jgi:hypothetical protein
MPRATALSGLVVLLAALVGWMVAAARGQNGHPYDWLLAAGGLAYLVSFAFFRWQGWFPPPARIGGPGVPAGNDSAWIVETSLRR